jgi:serine-type D-Ala-D-Ala carboxypeptidase
MTQATEVTPCRAGTPDLFPIQLWVLFVSHHGNGFTAQRNSAITTEIAIPRNESSGALNSTTPRSSLLPSSALESKDHIFSKAFSILEEAIAARAFPAASVAVTHERHLVALKAFGHFTYDQNPDGEGFDVTPATLFDLASLTKVVATTTMAMLLYERGLLDLDIPVAAIVPEFSSGARMSDAGTEKDPRRQKVTVRMLLAHSSGLPAYEKLFLKANTGDELFHLAFTTPLAAEPAARAVYSDIGFIILGAALERVAEEPLDRFCQREVFGPLGMMHTTFNPPPESRKNIPPTANEEPEPDVGTLSDTQGASCAREMREAQSAAGASPQPRSIFRGRIIQGEVQDENASVLGGVAGHAGLFSTAEDVGKFAHVMLQGGHPILRPETVALFIRREPAPQGTTRALGWDTPSQPSQAGKYFGLNSFGHLGYTGTSLWIDPDRQLSITLLTNRTWPDCSNQAIKTVRPEFHDAVIEALRTDTAGSFAQ